MISQSMEPESSSSKNTFGTTDVAAASGSLLRFHVAAEASGAPVIKATAMIKACRAVCILWGDMIILRTDAHSSLFVNQFVVRCLQDYLGVVSRAGGASSDAIKLDTCGRTLPIIEGIWKIRLRLNHHSWIRSDTGDIDNASCAVFNPVARPPARRLIGKVRKGTTHPCTRRCKTTGYFVRLISQRVQRGLGSL